MQKIFDFRSGAYVFVDDDDVVQEPTNIIRPRIKQIKCLTCKRHEKESTIAAVCIHCAADPSATLAHVYHIAEASRERLHETGDAYETGLQSADEPTLDRFNTYLTSTDTGKRTQAEQSARRGAVGALADLLRLWLAFQDSQAAVYASEAWVARCEEALQ